MNMNKRNPKVDGFLSRAKKWRPEFEKLRSIILDSDIPDGELTEELKWGHPCYAFEKGNVVLIHGFKDYCAILFPKGALLADPKGILIQQTENVQAARQVRFTTLQEIAKLEPVLKAYLREAIELEKSGAKVPLKKTSEFKMPEEFQKQLAKSMPLKTAFEKLTPGRQRAYLLHFAQPKQAKTREARVEKCMPQILKGKGLND